MLICRVGSNELLTNYSEPNFGAGFIDFISTHHKDSGKQSLGLGRRAARLCKSPISHSELLNAHWGTMSPINLKPQQEVQANDLRKVQMSGLQHIFSQSSSGNDSKGLFTKPSRHWTCLVCPRGVRHMVDTISGINDSFRWWDPGWMCLDSMS